MDIDAIGFAVLPPVFARPPAMWIPWPVKKRVTETFIVLMDRAIEAKAFGEEAQIKAHQLLKASGQPLLRVDTSARGALDNDLEQEGRANTLKRKVCEQLVKADGAKWDELLADLIAEVRAGNHAPAT